ncbi:hypothetical protein N1851_018649 [Merluccius polli]|uniref:DDE Tnp4 domain-containing protein n=1 Tax=Merluccius polli TaxID=89951 RepID=A0AA47P081_MERPO|nr:hypothetical protein N1851_018649 [Merluccius polli]
MLMIEKGEKRLRRRRLVYLRTGDRETRPLYCRINLAVPVLDRFFNRGDTRQDFRLSRESLAVITACAVLHNICLGVGDIMPPEDELQDAMPEDEGENGLEAVSGAPWRDRLSVEVSALEEVNPDHDYL